MTDIVQLLSRLLNGTISSDKDHHARENREALVRQVFPDLSVQSQLEIADATEIQSWVRKIREEFGDSAGSDEEVVELSRRCIGLLRRAEEGEFNKDSPKPPSSRFP